MRIAHVCFQRYPSPTHVGGGDVRLWQSLCSLRALGHDVHVIACDPGNERTPELDRVASSVTTLRSENMLPGTPRWVMSHVFNSSSLALAYPDLGGLRRSVSRVIGRIAPDLIWAEEERFIVHGFVENLGDVLLPGDASIMTYPFDTGGRVKFAVSAGYGVVNIAYEETFECSEEFTHGVDCLAARDPAHFAQLVNELVSDDALRLRLAQGSRAVYERHFTMEALYPKYEGILDIASGRNAEAVPCAS